MVKIFIDAGHGGLDPGATGYGLREKDITLAIALNLCHILNRNYEGHMLKLSRITDETVSLKRRTNMANQWGADLLISIHVNAGGGIGFESFTYDGKYARKTATNRLSALIHEAIIKKTNFKDRGKKEANFHMLRESSMSALLTENGFIDHEADASNLKSEVFLEKIALGHAEGLAIALDLRNKHHQTNQNEHFHIIKKGDTLWALAQRYETSVTRLLTLNAGIKAEYLQIGQKVRVKS